MENRKIKKETFEKLVVNSPDIILVLEKRPNLNRKIIYINKEFVLGYQKEEIMKEAFFQKIMHKDDLRLYRKFKFKVFDQKTKAEEEYRVKHKDGHWEWLNIKHSTYDENLEDEVEIMLLHIRIITEKKKAELLLEEQETNLRSIIENTDDSIWLIDRNFEIIVCNKIFTERVRCTRGKSLTIGDNVSELFAEGNVWRSMYERCFIGEKFDIEIALTDKATVHAFFNPIYNDKKDIEWINIKAIDITEKKKMEEILVRTNFELDSFVYRSSHDLRAPLRSILGLVKIISIEKDPDEKKRFLQLIEKSVNKLDILIADMTNFSRNIRLELELETINFKEIFEETHENLQFMACAENIKVTLVQHTKNIDYISDKKRIRVLFNNIISNAIKYQDPKKTHQFLNITIDQEPENGDITLTFEDNGLGIDKAYMPKIFDMFYRASLASFGSGLGLYIVAQVIEKLEGKIKVSSKLDEGTTLECKLPNLRK